MLCSAVFGHVLRISSVDIVNVLGFWVFLIPCDGGMMKHALKQMITTANFSLLHVSYFFLVHEILCYFSIYMCYFVVWEYSLQFQFILLTGMGFLL